MKNSTTNKFVSLAAIAAIVVGIGYYVSRPAKVRNADEEPNLLGNQVSQEANYLQGAITQASAKYTGPRHEDDAWMSGCIDEAKTLYNFDTGYDKSIITASQDVSGYTSEIQAILDDADKSAAVKAWWSPEGATRTFPAGDDNAELKNEVSRAIRFYESNDMEEALISECVPRYTEGLPYAFNVSESSSYRTNYELRCKFDFVGKYMMKDVYGEFGGALENNQLETEWVGTNDDGEAENKHYFKPYNDDEDPYFWYCYLKNEPTYFSKLLKPVEVSFKLAEEAGDEDNDGVTDDIDQCPGTPAGATVNEVGCPDTDGDGVYNNEDECPDTPAGVEVDEVGCAIETATPIDGECGSANGVTSAEEPTEGLCEVGEDSTVSESDGNWTWTCAGSDEGEDASCSAPVGEVTEEDPDGDGVIGDDDVCPTEAGPAENFGCPVETITLAVENSGDDVTATTERALGEDEEYVLCWKSESFDALYLHSDRGNCASWMASNDAVPSEVRGGNIPVTNGISEGETNNFKLFVVERIEGNNVLQARSNSAAYTAGTGGDDTGDDTGDDDINDRDGDGVPDNEDVCPNTYGEDTSPAGRGCPMPTCSATITTSAPSVLVGDQTTINADMESCSETVEWDIVNGRDYVQILNSNPTSATVKGLRVGSATIGIYSTDLGETIATTTVNVTEAGEATIIVAPGRENVSLVEADIYKIDISTAGATDSSYRVSSDSSNIIEVQEIDADSYILHAENEGSAVITVQGNDSGALKNINVSVSANTEIVTDSRRGPIHRTVPVDPGIHSRNFTLPAGRYTTLTARMALAPNTSVNMPLYIGGTALSDRLVCNSSADNVICDITLNINKTFATDVIGSLPEPDANLLALTIFGNYETESYVLSTSEYEVPFSWIKPLDDELEPASERENDAYRLEFASSEDEASVNTIMFLNQRATSVGVEQPYLRNSDYWRICWLGGPSSSWTNGDYYCSRWQNIYKAR